MGLHGELREKEAVKSSALQNRREALCLPRLQERLIDHILGREGGIGEKGSSMIAKKRKDVSICIFHNLLFTGLCNKVFSALEENRHKSFDL